MAVAVRLKCCGQNVSLSECNKQRGMRDALANRNGQMKKYGRDERDTTRDATHKLEQTNAKDPPKPLRWVTRGTNKTKIEIFFPG